MVDKVIATCQEAIRDIPSGATIMVGGLGGAGTPYSLVDALTAQGPRQLTIIGNCFAEYYPLTDAGLAQKVITCAPADNDDAHYTFVEDDALGEQIDSGEVELEGVPQGTFVERVRAGGVGLGPFYSPIGVGTRLSDGKEKKIFQGKEYILEQPLIADFALIKAYKGDSKGNLVYRKTARNINPIMAMAGRTTIAEVEEIVEVGSLDPEEIVTPHIFVNRIVLAQKQARSPYFKRMSGIVAAAGEARKSGAVEGQRPESIICQRVAKELKKGWYVNLGHGIPTRVGGYLDEDADVFLHTENGILDYGPTPSNADELDPELVASGGVVSAKIGASFFDMGVSFGIMRGKHLDAGVMGAFQVSEKGDIANWAISMDEIKLIGGSMDLAQGAKKIIVAMWHTRRSGEPRIVKECTYPITAMGVVSTIITNLCVIQVTPTGLVLEEVARGVTPEHVQTLTEATLIVSPNLKEMLS